MLAMPTPETPSVYTPMTEHIQQKQRIEDRIHSFMDALLAEIRKHKGWKSAGEEGLRSRDWGVFRRRHARLHREADSGQAEGLHAGRCSRRDEEGGRGAGAEDEGPAVPHAGQSGRVSGLQGASGDDAEGHRAVAAHPERVFACRKGRDESQIPE